MSSNGALIWSLIAQVGPSPLTASGNSGGWSGQANQKSPVNLTPFQDIMLVSTVTAAPGGTTPSLTVTINGFDDQGNLISQLAGAGTAQTAAGQQKSFAGLHFTTNQIVLPNWAQIVWTITGTTPSFPVEIALFGR